MILGVGMDIVDLATFRAQLEDPASQFSEGAFTAGEQRDAKGRPSGSATYPETDSPMDTRTSIPATPLPVRTLTTPSLSPPV